MSSTANVVPFLLEPVTDDVIDGQLFPLDFEADGVPVVRCLRLACPVGSMVQSSGVLGIADDAKTADKRVLLPVFAHLNRVAAGRHSCGGVCTIIEPVLSFSEMKELQAMIGHLLPPQRVEVARKYLSTIGHALRAYHLHLLFVEKQVSPRVNPFGELEDKSIQRLAAEKFDNKKKNERLAHESCMAFGMRSLVADLQSRRSEGDVACIRQFLTGDGKTVDLRSLIQPMAIYAGRQHLNAESASNGRISWEDPRHCLNVFRVFSAENMVRQTRIYSISLQADAANYTRGRILRQNNAQIEINFSLPVPELAFILTPNALTPSAMMGDHVVRTPWTVSTGVDTGVDDANIPADLKDIATMDSIDEFFDEQHIDGLCSLFLRLVSFRAFLLCVSIVDSG